MSFYSARTVLRVNNISMVRMVALMTILLNNYDEGDDSAVILRFSLDIQSLPLFNAIHKFLRDVTNGEARRVCMVAVPELVE